MIRICPPRATTTTEPSTSNDSTQYPLPQRFARQSEEQAIQRLVTQACTLNCRGWARADVMVRQRSPARFAGNQHRSGMTRHSLVPISARAGLSYERLCFALAGQCCAGPVAPPT